MLVTAANRAVVPRAQPQNAGEQVREHAITQETVSGTSKEAGSCSSVTGTDR